MDKSIERKSEYPKPETIIFDLGGVLIDWNPRYLYKKIFEDQIQMEWFLEHICTSDWNEAQDGGRSIQSANEQLCRQFPEWESQILAFYDRWTEMLNGPIDGTLNIFKQLLHQEDFQLYALTNWSAETWPLAWERFAFLHEFQGILVSGQENLKKPDPLIYQLILKRFNIDPTTALFIDDNQRNVKAAIECGIPAIQFLYPEQLKAELQLRHILLR